MIQCMYNPTDIQDIFFQNLQFPSKLTVDYQFGSKNKIILKKGEHT